MKNLILNNKKYLVVFSLLAIFVFTFSRIQLALAQSFRDTDVTYDIFEGNNPTTSSNWTDPVAGSVGDRIQGALTAWNTESDSVAQYTKVRLEIPTTVGTTHTITAHIWADNAPEVVDTLTITTATPTRLVYAPGHAVVFSPSCSSGCPLTDGALIGSGVTIGDINSGSTNSAQVTFKVDIEEPEATPTPTPTPSPTPTATPTATPTVTPTPTPTPSVCPVATVMPCPDGSDPIFVEVPGQCGYYMCPVPTPTPSVTPTPTATPTATPEAEETQLKICKYEDDNGNGERNTGENVMSWTFRVTYNGQTRDVNSHWWNVFTQGCVIIDVPSDTQIVVEEEVRSGWRLTQMWADGNKVSGATYSYTSDIDEVKVLWFMNTYTPNENPTSSCIDLDANPSSGTEDLTVELTATASDSAGSIAQYEYNFGDGTIVTESDNKSTHTYTNPGTYTAVLKVKDSRGNWITSDNCRTTITVNALPQVLGTTPPTSLPKTGFSGLAFLTLSTFSTGAGIYLYKRFKLL